jgi:hypothetical protein
MANISVNIKGLDKLLKKVENKSQSIKEEVDGELELFCQTVARKAKQRVPKDIGGGGGLAASTYFQKNKEFDYTLFSAKKYAPYVEFGTGGLVKVPPELQEYALQFKGRGVKKINIKPQPYFFNSFFEERPKLLARLRKIINETK